MFYALTASGRRAVEAGRHIMVDNSPSQRPEADPKELDFLLSKIRPTSSEQATEEASAFLLKIVSTHQIAKADMARIVSSANRFLSDEKEHWSRWLWILNMLSRTSDDSETTRLIGDKALPRVLALIKKPELQGPAREAATAIARKNLGEKAWHEWARQFLQETIERPPSEDKQVEDSVLTEDATLGPLKESYLSDPLGVLRWLFSLLEDHRDFVRLRAQNLIQGLRG